MTIAKSLAALALGLCAGWAQAQDCSIHTTRAACPGKETQSYAKCDGKAACEKAVEAASAQACQALAVKACANDRLDITRSKVIKASYKGQALSSASGKEDFCADYEKRATEFDQCPK